MLKKVKRIGPIQRQEIRLAFLLLLPTFLIVLFIVFLPLIANIWISFKPVYLKDLRPPTPIVKKSIKKDADNANLLTLEYRVRNSSPEKEIIEVTIKDRIPASLKVTAYDERCQEIKNDNPYNMLCSLPVLVSSKLIRLKIEAEVVGEWDRASFKKSPPVIRGKSDNILTNFSFTLENYYRMLDNEEFFTILKTTFIYTIFGTAGALLLGLLSALLLYGNFWGKGFVRGLLLFPYVAPVIAVAFTWVIIFDPFSGMFNTLLLKLGVMKEAINFFGQKNFMLNLAGFEVKFPLALTTVILFESWRYFPLSFLFILARMQSIEKQMYEAAEVDGASPLQSFWYILLPQLLAIFAVLFLLRFIWTFNKFDDIFLLTGGNAGTRTLTVDVYEQGFAIANLGAGAAVAVVIFVLLLTFSIFFFKFSPKERD